MGDDPYDFDIAIPTGGKTSQGNGKNWGGRRQDISDEESANGSSSDSEGSASGSEISLSDSEDIVSKMKKKNAPRQANKESMPRTGAARGNAASGTGGSNALDKAKSFLSKYSTKTTPTAKETSSSARSRRLEMSLDDEDFSLDSSGEEIQKSKTKSKTRRTAPSKAASVVHGEARDSEEEDAVAEDSVGKFTLSVAKVAVTTAKKARDEDSEEELYDHPQAVAVCTDTAPVKVTKYDSESDEYARQTPLWTAGAAARETSRPVVDEEDEVESIASQSESFGGGSGSVDVPRHLAVPSTAALSTPAVASFQISSQARQISAVSESGVYEDDDFEHDPEDATATTAPAAAIASANATTHRSREEESNFDYSLDFTEDPEPPVAPLVVVDQPEPFKQEQENESREERRSMSVSSSSSSSSSSLKSNRNSYVDDGGDDGEFEDECRKMEAGNGSEREVVAEGSAGNKTTRVEDDENYSQDDGLESTSLAIEEEDAVLLRGIPGGPQLGTSDKAYADRAPALAPGGMKIPVAEASTARDGATSHRQVPLPAALSHLPRPRVVIVREYELDRTGIETRDASTQFTGNHAGIQTDLVPDGMFSSHGSRQESTVSPSPVHTAGVPLDPTPSLPRPPAPVPHGHTPTAMAGLPPPPSPSPFSTYGLYDPLQLPVATSMSIYKQQLMALQQQIHQKKMDTERLFRDRIASRYSSLRGTDKYLAANRPTRMPLWQALVRVDPSLDEHKAKEIARLASDTVA